MGSLIRLAAWALFESGRAGNVRVTAIRMAAVASCAGVATISILAALGCAAAALWIFTLPLLGTIGAPLVVAATLTAMTLILATAAWFIMRYSRRGLSDATAPQSLLSEATRLFDEHKAPILLAAVVAGMAAANGGRKR